MRVIEEIENLEAIVLIDHHVGRLDVAMDDAGTVRPHQRPAHLDGNLPGFTGRQRPALKLFLEGLALVEGHDDIQPPIALADIVDGTDVRVVEGRGGPRLAQEALLGGEVPAELRRQQLDRHPSPEPGVLGLVDHAHASGADPAEQPVGSKLLSHEGLFGGSLREESPGGLVRRRGEESAGLLVSGQQGLHPRAKLGTPRTGLIQKGMPLARWKLERLVEEGLDPVPLLGVRGQIGTHPTAC